MNTENVVWRAIRIVAGRDTPNSTAVMIVAMKVGVTTTTIYSWIAAGRVASAKHAVLFAEATAEKGDPVPVRELAGLPALASVPPPTGRRTRRVPVLDCNRNHGSRNAGQHLVPVSRVLDGIAA